MMCTAQYGTSDVSSLFRQRNSLSQTVTVAGQGPGNYYASHDLDVQTEAFISSQLWWNLYVCDVGMCMYMHK